MGWFANTGLAVIDGALLIGCGSRRRLFSSDRDVHGTISSRYSRDKPRSSKSGAMRHHHLPTPIGGWRRWRSGAKLALQAGGGAPPCATFAPPWLRFIHHRRPLDDWAT